MIEISEISRIKEELKLKGWAIFKNDATVQLAEKARAEYFQFFNEIPLVSGGFTYEGLQKNFIRKKNISSSNGLGQPYAQVLQSMYYPAKHSHRYMEEAFQALIVSRNRLTSQPDAYGENPQREKFWNARRVHHYPQGGGFMSAHRDSYFHEVLGDMRFLQALFLITASGKDFQRGGGFIQEHSGNEIEIDQDPRGGMGAIIFFDGSIVHGIKDIDPNEEFSFTKPTGRISVIASLYEYRE